MHQNYLLDLFSLRLAKLNDDVLAFAKAGEPTPPGMSTRPGIQPSQIDPNEGSTQ
jgi:hypothetical protein